MRAELLKVWPKTSLPTFNKDPEMHRKLDEFIQKHERYQYQEIGFGPVEVKRYAFNMYSQLRKRKNKGADFSKVSANWLKIHLKVFLHSDE